MKVPIFDRLVNIDYLRGVFDGDGSMYIHSWHYIIVLSAIDRPFVEAFKNLFEQYCGLSQSIKIRRPRGWGKKENYEYRVQAKIVYEDLVIQRLKPIEDKAKYLAGLFDSEGSVIKSGNDVRLQFVTTNQETKDRYIAFCASFSIRAQVRHTRSLPSGKIAFYVDISRRENILQFAKVVQFNNEDKNLKLKKILFEWTQGDRSVNGTRIDYVIVNCTECGSPRKVQKAKITRTKYCVSCLIKRRRKIDKEQVKLESVVLK